MKKLLALLFIASTILISCEQNGVNEPDNPKDAPSFTFTEGTEVNPTIGYVGGELAFSFISNCSWTVGENDDWINISPTSGNQGNHTLAISVAKNTTGEERLSKITILYGVDSHVVINLTQEANEVFETDSEGNYIVGADGGTVAVKVTTNLEYDVIIPDEASAWLSLADTRTVREETLTFTVEENETLDERSAKVILKGSDGEVLQSIAFKQKGVDMVFYTDSEGNYIVETDGGSVVVKVTTNLEYDVIIPDEASAWLSIADTRAVREETLTFNVAKNEDNEERTAVVNLCTKGGEILQTITIKQNKSTIVTCANNEIIYTTKYDFPIELKITDGFGGNLMSHTYENGYGRIIFDDDVVCVPNEAFMDCTTITTINLPSSLSTIGSSVFSGCSGLASVTIGNGITSIGEYAFSGCTSLTSIDIPDSVKSVGKRVFSGCSNLASVTIGNSVTSIGEYAFFDCTSLTSIDIPDSVKSVGKLAFSGCNGLASVTIGNSVTSIGEYAFFDCTSLTSIDIPDSVKSVGKQAFSGCNGLASVTIGNSVTSIGEYAFSGCTSLPIIDNIQYADSYLVQAIDLSLSSYNIKDGTRWIGERAFEGCNRLISVTIPYSVISIGNDAFSGCTGELIIDSTVVEENYNIDNYPSKYGWLKGTNFTKLIVGDNITSIGAYVFFYCDNILNINIPDSVITIGSHAFGGCNSLQSVIIPDSVAEFGEYAFYDCSGLSSFTIPDSLMKIGSYVFSGCDNLLSITIPDNVIEIGDGAFYNCDGLTNVSIPDSILSIGEYAFSDCDSLTELAIPDSVLSVGKYAFKGCRGLKSVTIGDGLTSIRTGTFSNCVSLTDITIGNSVTLIADESFNNCWSLQNFKVPDSVTEIAGKAFYNCHNLESMTIGNSVISVGTNAFYGCTGELKIDSKIVENDYYYQWPPSSDGWLKGSNFSELTIGSSINSIGSSAFQSCSSLTSVKISDSVKSIGSRAFKSCDKLTNLMIGNCVTSIDVEAFDGCSSLTSVTIPKSVTSIEWDAFNCVNLTSFYCKPTTPPNGGNNMIGNNALNRKIYVPTASVLAYKRANYWSDYADYIVGYDFGDDNSDQDTGDLELNIPNASYALEYYGDYYGGNTDNWVLYIYEDAENVNGVNVALDLLCDPSSNNIAATYNPTSVNGPFDICYYLTGYTVGGDIFGSYYENIVDGEVTGITPITDGKIKIECEGDVYMITFDCVDDADKKITGTIVANPFEYSTMTLSARFPIK